MTAVETGKALAIIQALYPHFADGRDREVTTSLWHKMLADRPYPVVEAAIMAFAAQDVKGFPPSIGQVIEAMTRMQDASEMSEVEAWGTVMRALRNGLYGYQSEFDKLPERVRKTIGDPKQLREWALLDEQEVSTVIASNFMRSYRAKASAMREAAKLPEAIRSNLPGFERIGALPGC